MRIIYYLKGSDKPYLYKGSLKNWKAKVKQIENVTKWYKEKS